MNAEEYDYISNMAGVLLEAGTVYSSPEPGFNPRFLVGSVMFIFFSFSCYVLCCAVVLFCFPFFSTQCCQFLGMFILDCNFGFL